MFQTNPPEFNSAPDGSAANSEVPGSADRLNDSVDSKRSKPSPEFTTLEAFAEWIDGQLAELEACNEGFETVSSVRGFYGR